jgi:hypothetical protein
MPEDFFTHQVLWLIFPGALEDFPLSLRRIQYHRCQLHQLSADHTKLNLPRLLRAGSTTPNHIHSRQIPQTALHSKCLSSTPPRTAQQQHYAQSKKWDALT